MDPRPQTDSCISLLTTTDLISNSASGSRWVFLSARTLAVTRLRKARSSGGKDISETGAILNHLSLSTCKVLLDSGYSMAVRCQPLISQRQNPFYLCAFTHIHTFPPPTPPKQKWFLRLHQSFNYWVAKKNHNRKTPFTLHCPSQRREPLKGFCMKGGEKEVTV